MAATPQVVGETLRQLLADSHLAGPDDLPRLTAAAARRLGARRCVLHVVDYDQAFLVPLGDGLRPPTPEDAGEAELVPVEGTLAGRAFTEVTSQWGAGAGHAVLWVPVVDGTDRLGVMQVVLEAPDSRSGDSADSSAVVAAFTSLASLVAELLETRSRYGDLIQRARRRIPLTVPAELQWTQLPPLTVATEELAISGILVPTYEVAGDSFDYAIQSGVAHVAILDAMGHGMEAALLSIVAVGALRNARRAGLDLVDTVRSMDKHLEAHFGGESFVTAVVGELALDDGTWRFVTAGHPPALVVRQGKVVRVLEAGQQPPLGLGLVEPELHAERLEPGDRVVLHSDGVVEARDAGGQFFGVERLAEMLSREEAAGRSAPETLRRLMHSVLAHQRGDLQDDATVVLLEWRGPSPERLLPR
ncbi:MAG: PP2C family protein-serine/threonine phosphatase [Motilibacteraceae bacterium]